MVLENGYPFEEQKAGTAPVQLLIYIENTTLLSIRLDEVGDREMRQDLSEVIVYVREKSDNAIVASDMFREQKEV